MAEQSGHTKPRFASHLFAPTPFRHIIPAWPSSAKSKGIAVDFANKICVRPSRLDRRTASPCGGSAKYVKARSLLRTHCSMSCDSSVFGDIWTAGLFEVGESSRT
jgi:hypothetical protein